MTESLRSYVECLALGTVWAPAKEERWRVCRYATERGHRMVFKQTQREALGI